MDGMPRRSTRQDDAIVEAAWGYYHDGLNQGEIASALGVSRATVVNYLAEARRRNYVRISLDTEVFRTQSLSVELCEAFGLDEALVVPASGGDGTRAPDRVIRAAADWLPELLAPTDSLAVAWGETVYRLAETAPRLSMPDLTVVQALGARPAALGFAAETCSATLAAQFGARTIGLHVPLLLSNKSLRDQLVQDPVVAEQLQAVEDSTAILFAAGTCDQTSHMALSGLLGADALSYLRTKGATAVLCGHLIDQDGNALRSPVEDQMIGITLGQIKAKRTRYLVSAGIGRAAAIRAALRGGYVTHLSTCSDTAKALLGVT